MLRLLKLEGEGFCWIEWLDVELKGSCRIVMKGGNGKGKWSIVCGLVWGIYGKKVKGVCEVNSWKEVRGKD